MTVKQKEILCIKNMIKYWQRRTELLSGLIIFYSAVIIFTVIFPFLEYIGIMDIYSWPETSTKIDIPIIIIALSAVYSISLFVWLFIRYDKLKFIDTIVYEDGLLVTRKLRFFSYRLFGIPPANIFFDSITNISIQVDTNKAWECSFHAISGEKYHIKSDEGYSDESLPNLINLGKRLKSIGKEVHISEEVIKLVAEIEKKNQMKE